MKSKLSVTAFVAVGTLVIAIAGCTSNVVIDVDATVDARVATAIAAASPTPTAAISVEPISAAGQVPTISPIDQQSFSNIYVDMLRLIPDTPETRSYVWLNDYRLAAELAGVTRPQDNASAAEVIAYIEALGEPPRMYLAGGPFISGFINLNSSDDSWKTFAENRDFRGFDQRDVSASAMGGLPPSLYEVATGQFDPEDFSSRAACAECPEYELFNRNGENFYSWGEGRVGILELRKTAPMFDHIGRGGNVHVSQDTILRTLARDEMELMMDTMVGLNSSLGDREDLVALAAAMVDLRSYSFFLSTETRRTSTERLSPDAGYGASPAQYEELRSAFDDVPALAPYSAIAIGSGLDDRGPYVAVALYHESRDAAIENASRLPVMVGGLHRKINQQPWSGVFSEVETDTNGKVMSARLRTDRVYLWPSFSFDDEPLFDHE